MADESHVELEHKDVDEVLVYDDGDTPARQAYIAVLEQSGWKKVPKSRQEDGK